MKREEIRELLPLYALGALSEDERRDVEAALQHYPELLSELGALQETAADLSQAVAKSPRPELKARVLAKIQAQASAVLSRAEAKPKVLWPGWVAQFVAAAAIVLLVLAGSTVYRYYGWIQAFLDPKTRIETLVDENKNPVGRAIYRANGDTLVWTKLPPPPPGKTYQLWGVNRKDHVGLDTYRGGLIVFKMPQGYNTVHVTEEKAGGSQEPTQIRALPESQN